MNNLTNEQKAKMYNQALFQYQRLQEEVRQIKANSFDLSQKDEEKIKILENKMRTLYNQTQRLY